MILTLAPFATLPTNVYIRGPRYRVMFDRIVTPRFKKDVEELRTWVMDIRQLFTATWDCAQPISGCGVIGWIDVFD